MFDHPDLPDAPFEPPVEASIRLLYQMKFTVFCDEPSHQDGITFAKGAILGAEIDLQSGDAIVSRVFEDHRFRFLRGQYVVEIPAKRGKERHLA